MYRNSNNKVIGEERGDTYFSNRKGSKHLMRIMDAWGIDKNVLDSIKATRISITDTETKKTYSISKDEFIAHGVKRNFGFGEQVFTSRKFFTV